jgi:hypothetical protein
MIVKNKTFVKKIKYRQRPYKKRGIAISIAGIYIGAENKQSAFGGAYCCS